MNTELLPSVTFPGRALRVVLCAVALLGARAMAAAEAPSPATVGRISDPDTQMFFGYYDLPAVDAATGRHLANRVAFRDRLPTATDEAELGMVTLGGDGGFKPFLTANEFRQWAKFWKAAPANRLRRERMGAANRRRASGA